MKVYVVKNIESGQYYFDKQHPKKMNHLVVATLSVRVLRGPEDILEGTLFETVTEVPRERW